MAKYDVFVPKKKKKQLMFDIGTARGQNPVKGDIGIEIEVEGKRIPGCYTGFGSSKYWSYKTDGSLRGEENGEYVLAKPIPFAETEAALTELWDKFKEHKTVLDDSNRTSVHVHLNIQPFTPNRVVSLMALYIIFEEILTEWCGDHRVGNLFCLRAKDAPAMLKRIKQAAQNDFKINVPEGLHYSGMNCNAIGKFGSLEFRALRGCQDSETILKWCKILQRLYEASEEYKDPREIMYLFSGSGPESFFYTLLGDAAYFVAADIGWSSEKIRESMYEGVRLAQDICYSRNWSDTEVADMKADPFGRPKHRVANSLLQQINIFTNTPSNEGGEPPMTFAEWQAGQDNALSLHTAQAILLNSTPTASPLPYPPTEPEEGHDDDDYDPDWYDPDLVEDEDGGF